MWEPNLPALSAEHRVKAIDRRGFGESPLAAGPFSWSDDMIELIDEPSVLVGASDGGRIAQEVALKRPDLVTRLVLVCSGVSGWEWGEDMRSYGEREDELLEAGDIDAAVELNLRMWVDGPHRGPDKVDPELRALVAEMQRRAFDHDAAQPDAGPERRLEPPTIERLGEIAAPTLVIVGSLDVPGMLAIADRLATDIPDARKEVIEGAAHLPSLERPREFERLLLDFLKDG